MEINVNTLREEIITTIRRDVARAYQNRKLEKMKPEIRNTTEAVDRAKQRKRWFDGMADDEIVNLGAYQEEPNQATVTNPHDYMDLLREAFNLLAKDGYFHEEDIEKAVQEDLEHEFEHHVPALGNDGLVTRYGVEFISSSLKTPTVEVEG